jgi:hypothetical protein
MAPSLNFVSVLTSLNGVPAVLVSVPFFSPFLPKLTTFQAARSNLATLALTRNYPKLTAFKAFSSFAISLTFENLTKPYG